MVIDGYEVLTGSFILFYQGCGGTQCGKPARDPGRSARSKIRGKLAETFEAFRIVSGTVKVQNRSN
jgi:hypothetical protein